MEEGEVQEEREEERGDVERARWRGMTRCVPIWSFAQRGAGGWVCVCV